MENLEELRKTKKYLNNAAKPEGELGEFVISSMNSHHAELSDWGMTYLPERDFAAIADFGCGGGRNIDVLLKRYPQAQVTGLDYSEVSLAVAREVNKVALEAKRCSLVAGDVSQAPFAEGSFDLVTAFETVYFWPGPQESFERVLRVLRPGGVFLIVMESDGTDEEAKKYAQIIDLMRTYTSEQLQACLNQAGFAEVKCYRDVSRHWLTVLAKKH